MTLYLLSNACSLCAASPSNALLFEPGSGVTIELDARGVVILLEGERESKCCLSGWTDFERD